MSSSEIPSLAGPLTERLEEQLLSLDVTRQRVKQELSRVALVYSGQLSLDFEEPDPPQAA